MYIIAHGSIVSVPSDISFKELRKAGTYEEI